MYARYHSPLRFGALLGLAIALLALPIFVNIGVYDWVGQHTVLATLLWCFAAPLGGAAGLWLVMQLPLPHTVKHEFVRYGAIGVFNTLFNLALFNTLLYAAGVAVGPLVPLYAALSSAIVIVAAFYLNKYFVFDAHTTSPRMEFVRFSLLTGIVVLIDVGIVALLVNVAGAPQGITPTLWANIAVISTVPVSVLGNFFGYKFVVFSRTQ